MMISHADAICTGCLRVKVMELPEPMEPTPDARGKSFELECRFCDSVEWHNVQRLLAGLAAAAERDSL